MTTNEITTFKFQTHAVRTVVIDDTPYWVAKDVAEVLGYANTNDVISKHCKGVAKRYPLRTAGGVQELRVIGESDLYRLIAHSNLPAAVEFEAWIFEEVLPAIRKTGGYASSKTKSAPPAPFGATLSSSGAAREFRALRSIALVAGLKGNPATLSADAAMRRIYGVSPLGVLQITLEAEEQEQYLTPTELAPFSGARNAHSVNLALEALGMQQRMENGKWMLTDKGKEYGVLLDVGKRHNNGAMVQQIKWKGEVAPLLNEVLMTMAEKEQNIAVTVVLPPDTSLPKNQEVGK